MNNNDDYIPFSQRTGLSPIPPQLKIGEVSGDFRRLIDHALDNEILRNRVVGSRYYRINNTWLDVARDFNVRVLRIRSSETSDESSKFKNITELITFESKIGPLFDMIEFFYRHAKCSRQLKLDLANAFVEAKAAYRIVDGQIVAIGTEEQATAFVAALENSSAAGAAGARQHLIAAGVALRNGLWADSIRESIHAVESVAKTIEPSATTLGPALKALEKRGYIHPSLKAGFEKLYGYTNDESGIRHAILEAEVKVDETDALFMLGACASFVSYLIARSRG